MLPTTALLALAVLVATPVLTAPTPVYPGGTDINGRGLSGRDQRNPSGLCRGSDCVVQPIHRRGSSIPPAPPPSPASDMDVDDDAKPSDKKVTLPPPSEDDEPLPGDKKSASKSSIPVAKQGTAHPPPEPLENESRINQDDSHIPSDDHGPKKNDRKRRPDSHNHRDRKRPKHDHEREGGSGREGERRRKKKQERERELEGRPKGGRNRDRGRSDRERERDGGDGGRRGDHEHSPPEMFRRRRALYDLD